ncbi:MipA/OmpV family protein [Pragia fontium]|uniref:MipA/OmpV family protein n=1 Tax=Pragia fontium TaxID=82985 RepID=UPI0006492DC6|nr:MipA/OmpV family protein [Pragia fontium]AKJ42593.1 MltA-interacting protein MipA [Pragia fontium]
MRSSNIFLSSCVLGMVLAAPAANADTWSLGASAAIEMYPYKDVDNDVLPFPMIGYEGDNFFFRGAVAGTYLWKDAENQLSLDVYYSPLHFRPSKSDDHQMKQLDKRRSTMMGGIGYKHIADWGILRTSIAADMLNTSNGLRAEGAYLYAFNIDNLKLTPGVGVSWYSSNFNDYYYGISGHESRRSGLEQYNAGSSWSPYAELTANYRFNPNWSAFATGRYTRLDSEVKDSPMVDKSYTALIATGITYTF